MTVGGTSPSTATGAAAQFAPVDRPWSEMKAAVLAWINRTDMAGQVPMWRDLAEARIYQGMPDAGIAPLRIGAMLKDISEFGGALPDDFLQVYVLTQPAGERIAPLRIAPAMRTGPDLGEFVNTGAAIAPRATQPVSMRYYARLATPRADEDTNWLLSNAPGMYLYGMSIDAAQFLRDAQMLTDATRLYTSAARALIAADEAQRWAGAPLQIRMEGRRP